MLCWAEWQAAALTVNCSAGNLDRRYDELEAVRLRHSLVRNLPVITDQLSMEVTPHRQTAHAAIRRACISLDTCLRKAIGTDCLEGRHAVVRLVGELREILVRHRQVFS